MLITKLKKMNQFSKTAFAWWTSSGPKRKPVPSVSQIQSVTLLHPQNLTKETQTIANLENVKDSYKIKNEKKYEEYQYLNLVKECIDLGSLNIDRTGVGTLKLFGKCMRFSLKNHTIPLLTTKQVSFRIVLEELLFFIKGQTDNKLLKEKNVHIWDKNCTKEFLEKNNVLEISKLKNIERDEDDLGPIYGFQWRHFGAEYCTCNDDYSNKGIDQLNEVIETLKIDPNSRRLLVIAWNPNQLKEMALPPCHCLFQFQVVNGNLNCCLYQRSGDMGLGVPFNIASYSILTHIVAKLTNLEPGEFVHMIGDTHVYVNHIAALKIQIERDPRPFPKIFLKEKDYKNLEDFEFDDFVLFNYHPHERIVMKMAV